MIKHEKEILHYINQFESSKTDWRGDPSWLKKLRQNAIESFAKGGFPTRKDEDWKHTNVTPIAQIPFIRDGVYSSLTPKEIAPLIFEGTHLFVFVNGHYVPCFSERLPLPKGIIVESMWEALKKRSELLEPHLARYADIQNNSFTSLNTAFMDDGAFIYIPKGTIVEKPLHLLFLSSAGEKSVVCHPRNLVLAEENSQITLIESYEGFSLEPYFTNAVTEIAAGRNSVVRHYKTQEEGLKTFHIGTVHVCQLASSNFISHNISLGGSFSRTNITAELDEEECVCTLNGLYLTNGTQQMDLYTRINHRKPHGKSRQLYKGILDGKSRGVFNGKVFVQKNANKTDAKQTNKNLLLSDQAEADPTPQLEILADDVKVAHGATVGQLDKEQIFYLCSRGIDEMSAKSLLTYAFASDIIERIDNPSVKHRLQDALISHLPKSQIARRASTS